MPKVNKVLIIDDDEINNFVCYKVIEKNEFANSSKSVLSGEDGLNYLREMKDKGPDHIPDLILLDINMPIMNGWDFLKEYRAMLPDFGKNPVLLMLSSSVYEEDIEKANQYQEVSDYITKPLSKEVLDSVFEKYF